MIFKTNPKFADNSVENQSFTKSITQNSNAPLLIGDFVDVWSGARDEWLLIRHRALAMTISKSMELQKPRPG
jgi:UDP-2,3-diacylglucosamine pyrophosphatase LpxH